MRPAQKRAKVMPEIFCQRLKMAPGKAACGPKNTVARAAASPEFCKATSMEMVLALKVSAPKTWAPQKPVM